MSSISSNLIPPYSSALKANDHLYVSGQLPLNENGEIDSNVVAQTNQCLTNMRTVLNLNGFNMRDVVKTTVFMTDFSEFDDMNNEYTKFFDQPYPARSAVQVGALAKGAKLEIDCIAVKRK